MFTDIVEPIEEEVKVMLERLRIIPTKKQLEKQIQNEQNLLAKITREQKSQLSSQVKTTSEIKLKQIKDTQKQINVIIKDRIKCMKIIIPTEQQARKMANNIKVVPDEEQVKDMQRRMGIIPSGDFEQTKKDLDEIIRLRPKIALTLMGMTKEDYTLFELNPPTNL